MNENSILPESQDSPRLVALRGTGLLDSPPEEAFDRITGLVSRLLNAPIALMSLVDDHRQFFKSATGLPTLLQEQRETCLNYSFCRHVVYGDTPLVIQDSRIHPLVSENPSVAAFGIIAYLGVPLRTPEGLVLGSLCAIDHEPRAWTEEDLVLLGDLAHLVTTEIGLRQELHRHHSLVQALQEAERAASESARQMRLVTDHAPVSLAHCDRQHRVKFVNQLYAERYGMSVDEIIGRHVSEIVGNEAYESIRPQMEATMEGEGRRVEYEMEIPYATLGPRWVHVLYEPEHDDSGAVVGLIAVITDVTSRKAVETEVEMARDQALEASRAKDDFLAALSHELRTPLNPILLLASDAANNPELPQEIRQDFEIIRKNVELEARLIDDLLDFTRVARGKLSLEVQTVDLHVVLRDALETVQADLRAKKIEVREQLSAKVPIICGDVVRLQQVFWNVLKNGVKFTPEFGRISIRSEVDAGAKLVKITISDSGIGLSQEELHRIFEAFSQGDHARGGSGHRFGGLGLGLSISKTLIEMHSGRISASSLGPGEGAVFTIELPLAEEATANPTSPGVQQAPPQLQTPEGLKLRRILLVEDHEPTRSALSQLLVRRKFEVVSVGNMREAREELRQQRFDLLISDIGLPDGSGCDLMSEIQTQRGLPGIALTGYGMEADIAKTIAAGFAVHLTKPVRMEALDKALTKVWEDCSEEQLR